ncbi:MAG: hypothetical protein JSR46_06095 [Verrucomicrobia bacterium]|nr:hypothetical protein [Verrucomicrobiota bacterium]
MDFNPTLREISNPLFKYIYNYCSSNPQLPYTCTVSMHGTEYERLTLQSKLVTLQKWTKPSCADLETMILMNVGDGYRNGGIKTSGVDTLGFITFMNKAATLQPHQLKAASELGRCNMTIHEIEAIFDKVLTDDK